MALRHHWVILDHWPQDIHGKQTESIWTQTVREWKRSQPNALFTPFQEVRFHSKGVTLSAGSEEKAEICCDVLDLFAKNLSKSCLASLKAFKTTTMDAKLSAVEKLTMMKPRSPRIIACCKAVACIRTAHDVIQDDIQDQLPGAKITPLTFTPTSAFPIFTVKGAKLHDLLRLLEEGLVVLNAKFHVEIVDEENCALKCAFTGTKVDLSTQTSPPRTYSKAVQTTPEVSSSPPKKKRKGAAQAEQMETEPQESEEPKKLKKSKKLPATKREEPHPSKKAKIKQCFRCQRFGHSSVDCKAPNDVCRWCSGDHISKNCSAKDRPPSCANCGGQHPSSSGRCPGCPRTSPNHKKSTKHEKPIKTNITNKNPSQVDFSQLLQLMTLQILNSWSK